MKSLLTTYGKLVGNLNRWKFSWLGISPITNFPDTESLHSNLWEFSIHTSAAHTVISYFRRGLVSAAAGALFRCSSPVCNKVTRLLLDRCAPLSFWLALKSIQMCMEREKSPYPAASRISFHTLLVGPEPFLCCAGVGPSWLMGLSEKGHDPCYEVLPVSAEAVFRGLRWSQETLSSSRNTFSFRGCCHKKKKKITYINGAVAGTGEKPDSEMLLFTAVKATGRNMFTLWDRRKEAWCCLMGEVSPIFLSPACQPFFRLKASNEE